MKLNLLVIDELSRASAELLLQTISRWTDFLGDSALITALVDRPAHQAIILDMNSKSYKLRETTQHKQAH